ncbi:MAG: MBOAT family O-acyltransferase [Syntrophorhabdales bacterium]|jgi:D-alanyl-lipoteichoic acid acyltransferase DltB (MBOAT superfamily)
MTFNSHEFIFLFLPGTFIVYLLLTRWHLIVGSTIWLIFCSFVFCCFSGMKSGLLLAFSILFTYCIGLTITGRPSRIGETGRKTFLVLGIAVCAALLVYYKYTGFVIDNLNGLLGLRVPVGKTLLPAGISFFTFTEIAYLVDVYHDPERRTGLLNYALFISFFPRLLAGPIIRYDEIVPQLKSLKDKTLNYRNLSLGLYLFAIGLFKKVEIADRFSDWASAGFDGSGNLNFLLAWATSLSYTFQIYFDFSGYTDMAIGTALFFNIRLPINFNSPYKASDIQDFWRRWHITLTRFLRDYIYIPLGGNRVPEARLYCNLMATFLIGGLWHGAGWTFLFWGFLHGAGLIIYQAWKKIGLRLPRIIAWIVTFTFVNIAWVFFRAKSWGAAMRVLRGMLGLMGITLPDRWATILQALGRYGIRFAPEERVMEGSRDAWAFIFGALVICLFFKNSHEMAERFTPDWKWLVVLTAGVYSMLHMAELQEFIYRFF